MKKTILTLSILFLASGLFAQIKQTIPKKERLQQLQIHNHIDQKSGKTDETVIYYEDFDGGLPDDWEMVDLGGEGLEWYWSDSTITGCYTNINVAEDLDAETPENGVMVINPDGFNSVPQYTNNSQGAVIAPDLTIMDAYLQFGPLDLSDYSGINIIFYQRFRAYYDFTSAIVVSNDYNPENPDMAHWTEYLANYGIGNYIPNDIKEINISETTAGYDSVYIRIHAYGATHYYWIIDDIKLFEPRANDMILTDSWLFYDWFEEKPTEAPGAYSGYLQHGGGYYSIPQDQVTYIIGAQIAAENYGYADQTNVILNTEIYHKENAEAMDSVLVHTFQSEPVNYEAYTWDSIRQMTEFLPEEWGHYEVHMTLQMDSTDDYPQDNTAHFDFEIGDSTYSRTTDNITSTSATRSWIGGGNDGDGLGQYYRLLQPITEVEAFRFFFSERNYDYADLINAGGFKAIAKIFSYDEEANDWNTSPLISSEPWIATIADTGKWITIEYDKDGSNEYLQAGDYNVFLETHTSVGEGEDGAVGFYIGGDLSVKQPEGVNTLWLEGSWGISSPGSNFAFNLIQTAEGWIPYNVYNIASKNTAKLYQNYPNPVKDHTEIKYTLAEKSTVELILQDVAGKEILHLFEGVKTEGNYVVELDVSGLKPGVYYYSLVTDKEKITKKMIIIN